MNTSVHRLLDEAFAGLPATHDVQDLKEEIRANLLDRVAELTAGGVDADDAAVRAVGELGDVRALVEDADDGSGAPVAPGPGVTSAAAAAAEYRRSAGTSRGSSWRRWWCWWRSPRWSWSAERWSRRSRVDG
jgi:hypothetical protein